MIRLAFIGLGAAVRNIHLPAARQLAGRMLIVGGCDPDPVARDRATRLGVPLVTEGVEELLSRARPDLVAVCTPPAWHRAHAEAALAAGCHVLCEKPLAPTLADADAIVARADQAGRILVVNSEFPSMRMHAAARAAIGRPDFGRLLYLHAWHTMPPSGTGAAADAGWRNAMPRGLEFGIHVFDLVRFFFDATPARVFAHMPRPDDRITWDAIAVVAMEFADGRGASLVLDRLSRGQERYLELRLDGEQAAIRTSLGGQLRLSAGLHTRERRPFVDLRIAGGGRAVWQRGSRRRTLATDGPNPFASATARLLDRFIAAVEGRGPLPREQGSDQRETLAVALAAYASAENGRMVQVGA